jgi:MFS family permease
MGGLLTPRITRWFRRRTSALFAAEALGTAAIVLIGLTANFRAVLMLIVLWGLVFAASMPIRQAYLNGLIPSAQRATILSFDSLMSSSGGVVAQPALGRTADVWGYPTSYLIAGALSALALPFIARARRQNAQSDPFDAPQPDSPAAQPATVQAALTYTS